MSNPIPAENQNTGSSAWIASNVATTQIAGYCDKTSYNPGDTVSLFVSTQVASTTYSVTIYRLGYYGGTGGCQKSQTTGRVGVAQGYWDGTNLNNCPTMIFNSTTHLLEAGWAITDTWTIPGNAVTGVYLVQLTDANGKQAYTSFVVKGNVPADYGYIRADTTDCAYNNWGGFSLYTNPTVDVQSSFNKPNANGAGSGGLLQIDINFIKWIESQGYNLSYLSMIDVHANAASLLSYKAILSPGHNEYWSKAIRDGWEAAIAAGIGSAFMGANASYWQCRIDSDNAGNAGRTVTCYKVLTSAHNLALDPMYGVNNAVVTSQWRDAVLNRPENKMVGIMFSNLILNDVLVPWTVDPNADMSYIGNTGLAPGSSYGKDIVGYEYDKIQAGGPSNLKTIATTSLLDASGNPDTANTTYYIASSGAMVFASGAIDWTHCLDSYRWSDAGNPKVVTGMQNMLARIMNALIVLHSTVPAVSVFSFHR